MSDACRICGGATRRLFERTVLGRHDVAYFACDACAFVQSAEPFWLAEAHRSALSELDTGAVSRNLWLAPRLCTLLLLAGEARGTGVDLGGGNGLLTRLLRDAGFDFRWQDRYAENLFARGFSAEGIEGPVALASLVEVLEHSADPVGTLREAMEAYRPRLLFTMTELFEGAPPQPDWPYYAFESGQHVSFFSRRAMRAIAGRLGLHVAFAGRCQLFGREPIPQWRFRAAMSRAAPPAWAMLRRLLVPRTEEDHRALVERARRSR